MKIAGIIAEYDPFHTGHAYHIQKTREVTGADFIIVVMSGDFVQRGAPAFLPKHVRAKMALLGGADLVLELPSTHSCQSAERFARSGIELLESLGCVDFLSFGSESGNLEAFLQISELLAQEPEEFREIFQSELKNGLSFPAARERALARFPALSRLDLSADEKNSFLSSPNNILGIEYSKAIRQLSSDIKPITIKRSGSAYHAVHPEGVFPSAAFLRSRLNQADWETQLPPDQSWFPAEVLSWIQREHLFAETSVPQDYALPLRWMLTGASFEQLTQILDVTPALASRLIRTRDSFENVSQYISLVKTKEQTYSRISRALFHALLEIRSLPPLSYVRLLGFRRTADCVLTQIKRQGTLPLLTKLADAPRLLDPDGLELLRQNTRISNQYTAVLCEKTQKPFVHEHSRPLVIIP